MLVKPDGMQVSYFIAVLTDQNARSFLGDYHEYITSVDPHDAFGDERATISMVAVVLMAKQDALRSRCSVDMYASIICVLMRSNG